MDLLQLINCILKPKFKAICTLTDSSFGAEIDVQFHLEVTKKIRLLIFWVGIVDIAGVLV